MSKLVITFPVLSERMRVLLYAVRNDFKPRFNYLWFEIDYTECVDTTNFSTSLDPDDDHLTRATTRLEWKHSNGILLNVNKAREEWVLY